MSEQNKNTEIPLAIKDVFNELQSSGDFEIKPCKDISLYLNKYERLVFNSFDSLRKRINTTKDHPVHALNWVLPERQQNLKKINDIIEPSRLNDV